MARNNAEELQAAIRSLEGKIGKLLSEKGEYMDVIGDLQKVKQKINHGLNKIENANSCLGSEYPGYRYDTKVSPAITEVIERAKRVKTAADDYIGGLEIEIEKINGEINVMQDRLADLRRMTSY